MADFTPIIRLKLKEAFEDQHIFQEVECDADYLTHLFEWTDRGSIFIHDDKTKGYSTFVTDTKGLGSEKTFRVSNKNHKDLFLWHIDGVLYNKGSKCDCAFLTKGYMGFVEFKSNAANNTEAAIKGNYDKAKSQLWLTIKDVVDRCKKVGIDLMESSTLEAYAVFNRTVPRHNAYQKNLAARFLLETEGIPLYFRSEAEI